MQPAAASTRKLFKLAEHAVKKGQHEEAFQLYRQVLMLNPHHADALFQIASAMNGAGDHASAAMLYERVLQEDPRRLEAYSKLCSIYTIQQKRELALRTAQRATEQMPNNPKAFSLQAFILIGQGNALEKLACLDLAVQRFPADTELQQYYCMALRLCGRFDEADIIYQKLIASKRVPANFRMQFEMHLPRFSMSNEDIDAARTRFADGIARFTQEKPAIDLLTLNLNPTFTLAYHNRDNKELTRAYTQMLRTVAPELNFVAPHCKVAKDAGARPIKIGFLSQRMHNHVVGLCYRGILLHLATRTDFSVTFFNLANVMDSGIQEIIDAGIPMISLPDSVTVAQKMVAKYELDILVYPDIGMDLATHFMAMARLAPYQVCLGGHPETTGIDTVDYMVASREYEPEQAQQNYTEQLLCISGAAAVFRRPPAPSQWFTRAELGLPEDRKLYMCPMAIHKFHPDFDRLLAGILEKDPCATLVLFHDFHEQAVTDALKQRIANTCDPARIIYMPWLNLDGFQSILKLVDAVIDTIGFGGGTTCQYAFNLGVPIATMPGAFARGRMVYSYYLAMGIEEPPVAATMDEYIAIACRLANDRAYYTTLQTQILERSEHIFERASQTNAFTQLFRDIYQQRLESYKR